MIIIGAGLSGLLCGALNPGSIIYEAGEKKQNHKALFRCKTDQIGKVLGIPFKKVYVQKSIWLDETEVHSTPRIAHMYSQKVAGKISGRSITNIEPGIRYIPPDDFYEQLVAKCKISYNSKVGMENIKPHHTPVISTIPMKSMLDMLSGIGKGINFYAKPIYINRYEIDNCDSYCTVYYPDPYFSVYRASLNGNILITEGTMPVRTIDEDQILRSLGIDEKNTGIELLMGQHKQPLGKITPIDNSIREKIITELTLEYGIYSLGRFATWRPKVMLDDVLDDIWHIKKLIQGGNYATLKHRQSEEN